jgi:shikimate kinase
VTPAAAARSSAQVALIGFMGSGKSTVGRLLAARLGYAFLDMDEWIEARQGRTVRQIFQIDGEEAFRELESSALRELSSRRRVVIAAGGGAPVREANWPFFRQAATFYLEISFEEFLRRTASNPDRPLRGRPVEELRLLFESRLPVYRELGQRVSSQSRAPAQVVEEILERLRTGGRGPQPRPDRGPAGRA